MSRVRQELSVVQFQVQTRQASASMDALGEKSNDLNTKIETVKKNIADLGNVPIDDANLVKYQSELKQLTSDLRDVTRAQNELMKGVKAADKLWQAAKTGTMEKLSVKEIEAGIRGMKVRQKNLQPGGEDAVKMQRAMKAAIEEGEIAMRKFEADVENLMQAIANGGNISNEALRKAKEDLRGLVDVVPRGTDEWKQYNDQLKSVEGYVAKLSSEERRLAGEIVTVEDAIRKAGSISKEDAEKQEAIVKKRKEAFEGLREQSEKEAQASKQNIENTEKEIAALEEKIAEQKKSVDALHQLEDAEDNAEKAVDEANKKIKAAKEELKPLSDAAMTAAYKVHELEAQLKELEKEPIKPKVDTSEIDALKAKIESLKAQLKQKNDEWLENSRIFYPHKMFDSYEEFFEETSKRAKFGATFKDRNDFISQMRERKRKKIEDLIGDEVNASPAYRDKEKIAKSGFEMGDKRLDEEYLFGAKEAKAIIAGEEAYEAACEKVEASIKNAHEKLREAFESGLQPEQVKTISSQLNELEQIYLRLTDLGARDGFSFMGSGKDIVTDIFGEDLDKKIAKIEAAMKRAETIALKEKDEYWEKTHTDEIAEAQKKRLQISQEEDALKKELAKTEAQLAEATKGVTAATEKETKSTEEQANAVKELEQELDMLNKRLKEEEEWEKRREGYLNDSLKELEQMGIAEADIADESKVREAAEKKVLEIMEAEKRVAQEIAEQRRELSSKVTSSQLGGTKADQEFYAKNAGNYSLDQYKNTDEIMDRIAHLEMVSKLKNGKRFSDDTYWDPEDDVDEDDLYVMTDEEKQYAIDELRVLKQHIREEILKALNIEGDLDKAIQEVTDGGDGFSEDSKFGQQINDKIESIKEKIEEQIKTSLDAYEELVEPNRSDIDETINKEGLAKDIQRNIRNIGEQISGERDELEWAKDDVKDIKEKIAAKQQEIELAKQQNEATREETQADEEKLKVAQELVQAQKELDDAKKAAEAPAERLKKAEEELTKAEEDEKKATEALNEAKKGVTVGEQEDKLADLEKQHKELTDTIANETAVMEERERAAKSWAEKETEAAIELAQAQNQSQEAYEGALQVLEKAHKSTNEGTDEYNEQAEAIDKLKEKLGQMKGELMSLEEAKKLAGQAGTDGFFATPQMMNQAVQAIERRRAAIVKVVRTQQDAGKETEKEEEELKQLDKLLKDLKFEQDNFNMSHQKMVNILKEPKSADDLDELRAAIKRADGELHRMEKSLGENNKEYQAFAKEVKGAKNALKEMENQSKANVSQFDKAWSRLKTYIGLYMGAAVAIQKLVATMGDLMELSDKMGEVRKTTGFTADEVGRLSDNLAKLDTRTPIQELLNLSAAGGQLGLKSQEDVRGFTEAANQLIVALPEMGRESATTLMKISKATGDLQRNGGDVQGTLERVGSTIIALRANSASAAPAITDFVARVGAVGSQAGITIDQIAALGSTIDALGGRVEMSATALSRMIPAIRNNAFGVANAIGVTEKTLTDLFNQGKSMEAMVLIFRKMRESVKQFDTTTEEGMNAMADNVEALLGKNASMAEVMKELNQQGARAGIVFGLMSQNVDELERQLGIAADAYKDNIALMNEYNNMNETTAAKWERLKNQLEEMFVGDGPQRMLGGIIDGLRWIIDLISGRLNPALNLLGVAIKTIIVTVAVARMGFGKAFAEMIEFVTHLRYNILKLTASLKAFYAANKANIWMAIAVAIAYAAKAVYDWVQRLDTAANALAEAEANLASTTRQVGLMFHQLTQLNKKQDELNGSTKKLKDREAELTKEVESLRKKLGEGAEQSSVFKKKQEELADAHEEVAKAEGEASKATGERLGLINEINSKYSTYLGYMLSEVSTAESVASAHDLIIARLKEEMYWREQNNAFETVTKQHSEALKDYREASLAELNGMDAMRQQNIMSEWQSMLSGVTYDASAGGFIIPGADKAFKSIEEAMEVMKDRFGTVLSSEGGFYMVNPADKQSKLNDLWGESGIGGWGSWTRWGDRGFKDWTRESLEVLQETALLQGMSGSAATRAHETAIQKAKDNIDAMKEQAQQDGATNKQIAEAAVAIAKNYERYGDLNGYFGQNQRLPSSDYNVKAIVGQLVRGKVDNNRLQAIIDEATRVAAAGTTPTPIKPAGGEVSPYGTYDRVSSDYGEWDADSLVARRKEMLERVRALANGADVQAVLSEDAKFITEATRKNIKTTKEAIEWYNTERLKIQDALHEKHLTNTGDWLDPTKKKGRKKTIKDEWSAYIEEIDAYYTERKAKIQEAQNDEEISEAEAWKRTLQNEAVWHQRRAELQKLYANKSAEVTAEEQQAIFNIISERTGDSSDFIQKTIGKTTKFIFDIGKHSEAEMRDIFGDLDLGIEKDYLKQRNAVGKQMDAIRDIIEKERPYNGITENLKENLTKMNILFADWQTEYEQLMASGANMTEFNRRQASEEGKRMMFVLTEAEHAYNTTIDEVMQRMADKGLTAWAEALQENPKMQEGLMNALRNTFDKTQEAIKKEASLWKKEAENMWNNILMPDGQTTLKQVADKMVAELSLTQGRVSRANNLIGAGQASERVVDKLAIQQMKVQLAMQQHYFNLMRQRGQAQVDILRAEAKAARERGDTEEATRKELDAQHATMTLNLATTKEQTELAKQQEEIIARTEESQNRLYTELKSWADLFASSLQSVFEASNTGLGDYYNSLAKMRLTGEGAGGGTYVIIENAGTSDAEAHYEYLDGEAALRRQLEIEQQNAVADAWKKVMDDINMKINDLITDQINAMLQNASIDLNTEATNLNTAAIEGLTEVLKGNADKGNIPSVPNISIPATEVVGTGTKGEKKGEPVIEIGPLGMEWEKDGGFSDSGVYGTEAGNTSPYLPGYEGGFVNPWTPLAEESNAATEVILQNQKDIQEGQKAADRQVTKSSKASFAAMTAAANMYGVAYQAMANDNLSTTQKVEMMIVQAAGQAAISMLTASLAASQGETAANAPSWISKTLKELGPIGGPVAVGVFTALIGGLMGLAMSKITKSKSEIAQVTGASMGAGRLSTGMLTYAEGNVNEFTDPNSLTPGRHYNVDGADGKTYRAKYMGKNAKTHITNGPEFHLVGEAGREAIIDAHTTRLMQMNDTGIWQAIQTLYNGGSLRTTRRRSVGRGIRSFADGNLDEFEAVDSGQLTDDNYAGYSMEQMAAMQSSLDRQNDLLEQLLTKGVKGYFDVYGKNGLVDSYDRGKKTAMRHGERY